MERVEVGGEGGVAGGVGWTTHVAGRKKPSTERGFETETPPRAQQVVHAGLETACLKPRSSGAREFLG